MTSGSEQRAEPGSGSPARVAWMRWLLVLLLLLLGAGAGACGVGQPDAANMFDGIALTTVDANAEVSPDGLAPEPAEPLFTLAVTGRRWFWELDYLDYAFFTADDLYVPVGEVVLLQLTSADVPHTWWIPAPESSLEVLPDELRYTWLYATEPGVYEGVCAENCDDPTAYMPLRIIAVSADEFEQWVAQQQAPAPEPTTALTSQGKQLMQSKACLGCHALGGINENVRVGPNLSNMALRTMIAGVVPYSPDNMRVWLQDPLALKPGTSMPRLALSEEEVEALVAYMDTLK